MFFHKKCSNENVLFAFFWNLFLFTQIPDDHVIEVYKFHIRIYVIHFTTVYNILKEPFSVFCRKS